jgi:hypothetical protein
MAKALDSSAAGTRGYDPQAARRIASDHEAADCTAFDPTRGEAPPPLPDASGSDGSEGLDAPQAPDAFESQGSAVEPVQVGPGRPPRDTRWKKGGLSPNPRGRPRKDQAMLPDVRKAFEQALNKKISVPRGDRQVLMTRLEIGFEQLLNQFAKGDRYARRDLMGYADKLGVDLLAKGGHAIEHALTPNYQTILNAFLARRRDTAAVKSEDTAAPVQAPVAISGKKAVVQRGSAAAALEAAPAQREPAAAPLAPVVQQRVFAPPELLDDDIADETLAEPEAPPPAVEIKPRVPLPMPIPGEHYPKPPERMSLRELLAWYPEWYAQHGEEWEKQRLEQRRRQGLGLGR